MVHLVKIAKPRGVYEPVLASGVAAVLPTKNLRISVRNAKMVAAALQNGSYEEGGCLGQA